MICAWKELLNILPQWMRKEVDSLGREEAQDIRLRLDQPPEVVMKQESKWISGQVTQEDLNFCVNAASKYSPWAAGTISQGFITAPGGHRIGICGEAVIKEGRMAGIRNISSLCIRVARDFPGIGQAAAKLSGSILIIGAPGWGKTTLLRDLIRQKSHQGFQISVVDERGELFPTDFSRGERTSVLTGCPKAQGIELLIRTMGPQIIAVDEITAKEDCEALKAACCCGVSLIATAHASSLNDYLHREVYAPLVRQNLFEHILILHPDKQWHLERSGRWTTNGSVRY